MSKKAIKKRILMFPVVMIVVAFFMAGCATTDRPDALSESEIIEFNKGFFNSESDSMNNMLLSSEYRTSCEIDLFQLFYNGTGEGGDQISAEEVAMLTELNSDAPYLDVVKITADEMDAFLQERLLYSTLWLLGIR